MSSNDLNPQMLRTQSERQLPLVEGPLPQPPQLREQNIDLPSHYRPVIRDAGLARDLEQEGVPPLMPFVERPLTENVRINRVRDRALRFADLLQNRGNEVEQPVIPHVVPIRPHRLHLPEAGDVNEEPIPIPPPLIRRNRQELAEFVGPLIPPPAPLRAIDAGPLIPPPAPLRAIDAGPLIPPPAPLRAIDAGPLIPPPAPLRVMNAEPFHDGLTEDQRNIIRGGIQRYNRNRLIEHDTDPDDQEPLPNLHTDDILTNKYLKYKNKYIKLKMKNK
jgi:hypothetical protein